MTVNGAKTSKANSNRSNVEGLVNQSTLIFIGVVEQTNATNIKSLESVRNDFAIVRINKVLHTSGVVENRLGKEITVLLTEPKNAKVGQHIVFFTNPYLYANEGIAVQERGQLDDGEENITNQVREAAIKLANKNEQDKIATADIILVGRVSDIRETEQAKQKVDDEKVVDLDRIIYYEAVIEVQEVLKGKLSSNKKLKVIFNNNADKSSWLAPKYTINQTGLFYIHKERIEELDYAEAYTTFNTGDFKIIQSKDEVDRIKELIVPSLSKSSKYSNNLDHD